MALAAGSTHVGGRTRNQDAYLINEALGLYLVADGVGGHAGGEVASELACQVVNQRSAAGDDLSSAIRAAHESVLSAGRRYGRAGMATTMVAAQTRGADLQLAWVGDSRAYLWDGRLTQLTQDQTRAQEMVQAGLLTPEVAEAHPDARILSQAVGAANGELRVGHSAHRLDHRQVILLCTDGVWTTLEPAAIASQLKRDLPVSSLAASLVDRAVAEGSRDNCTALVLRGA